MDKNTLYEWLYTILSEHDVCISSFDIEEHGGEYCIEIEFYSPAGEDFIETIWFSSLTKESIINSFRKMSDSFDEDAHVESLIGSRGKNNVPSTIRELCDDADAIKDKLNMISMSMERQNKRACML